jgi:hypothetical protein
MLTQNKEEKLKRGIKKCEIKQKITILGGMPVSLAGSHFGI